MKYNKIIIKDVHRSWKVHISPSKNFESIKNNGLIRPDILKRNNMTHCSPYDVFESTKKGGYRASLEKDAYTYFGQWGHKTFQVWKDDATVIDNNIGFILKDESILVESYDFHDFKRFRSDWESIPFV